MTNATKKSVIIVSIVTFVLMAISLAVIVCTHNAKLMETGYGGEITVFNSNTDMVIFKSRGKISVTMNGSNMLIRTENGFDSDETLIHLNDNIVFVIEK